MTIPESVKSISAYSLGYYYDNSYYKKTPGFTIYGCTGSEAERYADSNGFNFISTGTSVVVTPTETPTTAPIVKPTEPTTSPAVRPTEPGVPPTEPGHGVISDIMLGDADCDDEVTILDATAIQRYLAGLPVAAFSTKAADADEDEEVTILDATTIQRYLAGLSANENIGKRMTA